jgi:hypothetical protein
MSGRSGADQGITPPGCMHDSKRAETKRGCTHGCDCISAFQAVEPVDFEMQGTAATLGEAQANARHGAVPQIPRPDLGHPLPTRGKRLIA